jgi:inner membrane protein YidH
MTMSNGESNQETKRFEVKATAESHFSWLRTRMSAERTLMSWVRTAIALIGFGFTIFQFLDRFNRTPGVEPAAHPQAPWIFGLALIGTGIIALIIALWEYRWGIQYLWSDEYKPIAGVGERWHTPVVTVTAVLIVIGIFAFGAVFLRVR